VPDRGWGACSDNERSRMLGQVGTEWDIDISGRRYASGFDHLSVLGVDESVGLAIGDAGHGGPKAVIRRGKNSPVATFESGWC